MTGGLIAVAMVALVQLLWTAPAWAEDPPDLRGLSVADATAKLLSWDKTVIISTEPEPLPRQVDPAMVVVYRSSWLNPKPIDQERPRVLLELGALVPDLRGQTPAAAAGGLAASGLVAVVDPGAGDDWLVDDQRPFAGTIVPLGQPVSLILVAAPATVSPTPTSTPDGRDPGGVPPVGVLVAVGVGLLLVAGLGTLALRRGRARRARAARTEQVSARGYHGQVRGPEVQSAGPDLAVRVSTHADPPTIGVEEVGR